VEGLGKLSQSRLSKGGILTFGSRMAGMACGYAYLWLIARWFGAREVGFFTICFSTVQIASLVGRMGTETLVLRASPADRDGIQYPENLNGWIQNVRLLLVVALLGLTVTAMALYAASNFMAVQIFKAPALASGLRWAAAAVPALGLLVFMADFLRNQGRVLPYALYLMFLPFFLAGLFLAASKWFSLEGPAYLLPWMLSVLVCLVMVLIASGSSLLHPLWSTWKSWKASLKKLDFVKNGLVIMVSGVLSLLITWTDTLMVGYWRSEADVGVYAVVMRLSTLVGVGLMAANSLAAPRFAKCFAARDHDGLYQSAQKATTLGLFLGSLPLMVLLLGGPWVLGLFGSAYLAGHYAMLVLLIGQFLNVFCGSVGYFLQMTGYERALRNILLVAVVLNFAGNALLIPPYGLLGAAVASSLSMSAWNLLGTYLIWKKQGFVLMLNLSRQRHVR
jgi:O-antigen/teichoic acid export membrane protein